MHHRTSLSLSKSSSSSAPFGLAWGARRSDVRGRFPGLRTAAEAEHALVYPLASVAELIWAQGGFCPAAFLSAPERLGDEIVLNFANEGLQSVFLRFGYSFESIGQDTDTLSDQAMSAHAKSELQQMILELAVRYGAPSLFTDTPMRDGTLHVHGCALFALDDGGAIQIKFGHDGAALAGTVRYQAPAVAKAGF